MSGHFNYHFGISRFVKNRLSTRRACRYTCIYVLHIKEHTKKRRRKTVRSRYSLRLSSNNKYKSNGVRAGYTAEEFLSEFITIFLLQSLLRRLERIAFSCRRGLCADRFVVVSGFAEESRLWKRSGYQFDSDAVKGGERERERAREDERATLGCWMRRGCEGIQFPSSRGWRAAHTLPFGAVTPRELWSPNEWLGRAKRRITYFFFFLFFFSSSRSCTLFQDVYKYGNRTCLPTLTTRRRPRSLSLSLLDVARHA